MNNEELMDMNNEKFIERLISEAVEKEEQYLQSCMAQKKIYHPHNQTHTLRLIIANDNRWKHIEDKLRARINKMILKEEYRDYIFWSELEDKRINVEKEIAANQKELNELMERINTEKEIAAKQKKLNELMERINTEKEIAAKQKKLNELMETLDDIKYIQAEIPFENSSEEMTSSHTK